MLSSIFGSCCLELDTGQNFGPTTSNISSVLWSPKRSTTVLDPLLSVQLFQHCWGHACAKYMVSKILWVVSFPRCTAGPKIIGSWCSCLHNTGNADATTLNIVSPTLLGVVVSVYTWLKCERISTSYITWISENVTFKVPSWMSISCNGSRMTTIIKKSCFVMHSEYIYNLKQTDASETLWYLIEQLLDDADFDIKLWRWLTPCQMCIIFHTKEKLDIF